MNVNDEFILELNNCQLHVDKKLIRKENGHC